jgi:hypothetical protein
MTTPGLTGYEEQSIAIAKYQLWCYIGADVIAFLGVVAAIVGGVLAYRNIKVIAQQLEIARWNTLLSFEQDMATRRTKFHDISAHMQANPDASAQELQSRFDEAKESYFNSLDRLASSILNGHFPDSEMRQDYHEAITGVVRAFPADFATGTHFRKVVKLYNRWQDRA